eukprot:TRINITY_DN9110_c0_g1_i1.p1 TRINITY_DN9110_c0_g1~~TRINITY_DN9110_c0_g1_i1.p1  ORF type:complete len:400 (+),score=80.36 TRINITY_DN9110_c0_g1_i1:57-1256(+)
MPGGKRPRADSGEAPSSGTAKARSQSSTQLQNLLAENKDKDFEGLLLTSVRAAYEAATKANLRDEPQLPTGETLDTFLDYVDICIHWVPHEDAVDNGKTVYNHLCAFYWLLDQPTGLELQKHKSFTDWIVHFCDEWGKFCDTPQSFTEESFKSFCDAPSFNIHQYQNRRLEDPEAPNDWLTFNQFFARQVKPGLRPVAGITDDRIIVNPADCTFKSMYPIDAASRVTVKYSHTYYVRDLLEGSPYKERFHDGLFMHSFLGPADYHRFRAPVRGTVLECRKILGKAALKVQIDMHGKWGSYDAPDPTGYQFSQMRGLIVFDSPVGLVAVLPVGMCQVSSVNMTAVRGSYLNKGEEFGFFMFGGSDIILLFEKRSNVKVIAPPGVHRVCNAPIAEVIPPVV